MRKRAAAGIVTVVVTVGLCAVSWWLFGWTSYEHSVFGKVTATRFLGRYVKVASDADFDGHPDFETRWPWSEPYIGNINATCGDPAWTHNRSDRNLDGQWDTWQERPDRENPCTLVIKADLDGDGNPDLIEECAFHQSQERIEEIDRERGFPPLGETLEAIARDRSKKGTK